MYLPHEFLTLLALYEGVLSSNLSSCIVGIFDRVGVNTTHGATQILEEFFEYFDDVPLTNERKVQCFGLALESRQARVLDEQAKIERNSSNAYHRKKTIARIRSDSLWYQMCIKSI